jgi:hypothetical protein
MSYEIDPERRAELLETATLGGNQIINGLELRPVTSATWSLLTRLGNSFITGQQDGDYAFAVYSFVYLHSKPIADIRKRISTIDDLRADVYAFMDERPLEDVFRFVPFITAQMEQIAATITQAAPALSIAPVDNADPKA